MKKCEVISSVRGNLAEDGKEKMNDFDGNLRITRKTRTNAINKGGNFMRRPLEFSAYFPGYQRILGQRYRSRQGKKADTTQVCKLYANRRLIKKIRECCGKWQPRQIKSHRDWNLPAQKPKPRHRRYFSAAAVTFPGCERADFLLRIKLFGRGTPTDSISGKEL